MQANNNNNSQSTGEDHAGACTSQLIFGIDAVQSANTGIHSVWKLWLSCLVALDHRHGYTPLGTDMPLKKRYSVIMIIHTYTCMYISAY